MDSVDESIFMIDSGDNQINLPKKSIKISKPSFKSEEEKLTRVEKMMIS